MKPSQILLDLCKREGRPHPEFIENECKIGTKRFIPNSKSFKDEKGTIKIFATISDIKVRLSSMALHNSSQSELQC